MDNNINVTETNWLAAITLLFTILATVTLSQVVMWFTLLAAVTTAAVNLKKLFWDNKKNKTP